MILHRAPQGSPEWHAARAGCISASNFHLLRTRVNGLNEQQAIYVEARRRGEHQEACLALSGYKKAPTADVVRRALLGETVGEFSDTAKNYAFRLAIERISGKPLDEGFTTWAMERGHELEPAARMKHEMRSKVLVEEVGFITTDDGKFGCSADGFIDDDIGCEYKCFISPEKLRAIYLTGDTSEVIDQCDGGMWVTGRKQWVFGLYCPALETIGLDLELHEIDRDDDRIQKLEDDLIAFEKLVTEYETKLRAKACGDIPWDASAVAAPLVPVVSTPLPTTLPANLFA